MSSFNKVLLMGNLVRDPELRATTSGLSVATITIAASRSVRSEKAEGGMREETVFVDVEAFGKQAETIAKFFTKGRPIFVEGRLRLNEWTNQNGEKRSKLLVVLENFVFVGSNDKAKGADGLTAMEAAPKVETSDPHNKKTKKSKDALASEAEADEDVPF